MTAKQPVAGGPLVIVEAMFSIGVAGLERAALEQASMLAARGHRVHFVLPQGAGIAGELQRLAQASVGRIVPHALPMSGVSRLLLRWRLAKLLRETAPDVLLSQGAKATSRMAAVRPAQVPLIATTHNASPRLMRATHLIALTRALKQVFIERGFAPERIWQVPNALPQQFADIPLRTGAGLQQPAVIGVFARLIQKKGVDVFLRGLRLALDNGLQARALIGGDGALRAELEALCEQLKLRPHVSFAGWVADAAKFYDAIDILCVPSRDEPFGIVVLEGFAHGTPVMAAAVGGPRELIEDGVNGALFESENPASLAAALQRTVDAARASTAIRDAAYERLQDYRGDAVGEKLEAVLRAAVGDMRTAAAIA